MVLPWSMGERVLAILEDGHEEGSRDGSAVEPEALPPYEERDTEI